jgi:hypothetical protein
MSMGLGPFVLIRVIYRNTKGKRRRERTWSKEEYIEGQGAVYHRRDVHVHGAKSKIVRSIVDIKDLI